MCVLEFSIIISDYLTIFHNVCCFYLLRIRIRIRYFSLFYFVYQRSLLCFTLFRYWLSTNGIPFLANRFAYFYTYIVNVSVKFSIHNMCMFSSYAIALHMYTDMYYIEINVDNIVIVNEIFMAHVPSCVMWSGGSDCHAISNNWSNNNNNNHNGNMDGIRNHFIAAIRLNV